MVTTIICTIQHEQGSALKKIETNFAQLRQIHGFHKQIEKKNLHKALDCVWLLNAFLCVL